MAKKSKGHSQNAKGQTPLPLILEPLLLFWAVPHPPHPLPLPGPMEKKTYIVPYTFEYRALNFELINYLFIYLYYLYTFLKEEK